MTSARRPVGGGGGVSLMNQILDLAEQLGVKEEEVQTEASFVEDLGADSLDTVELVMALEEEFETEILEHLRKSRTTPAA